MMEDGLYDRDIPVDKYAMSYIACKLSSIGMKNQVEAWNNHFIAGKTTYTVLYI